jgi:phosphatidylglycerol:prolipoprotein diacylglycerol transferase
MFDMSTVASLGSGLEPVLGYFVLNIDPILFRIGPIAIHWYGLAYVVGISIALFVVSRWARRLGIHDDQIWSTFLWTALGGLIGGRLYYVIQQPDLWQNFILKPINIIAVWDGGMAFFGAIFLGSITLFIMAPRYNFSPWLALDGGALFAAVGQIFGRFGNIVNGDIVGYAYTSGPITVPGDTCAHAPCIAFVPDAHIPWWATMYLNPNAFHAQFIPYQPAALYEIGLNLIMLAILWQLRFILPRVVRAGYFFAAYLAMYAISQFIVFFARDNVITPFLGIDSLKQAQWTAVFVFVFLVPAVFLLARRYSKPWPYSYLHPVPWPPAADEVGTPARPGTVRPATVTRASLAARASTTAKSTQAKASAAKSTQAKTARASAADGPTGAGDTPDSATPDLSPWQPAHPTGGQLRNIFGTPQASEEPA